MIGLSDEVAPTTKGRGKHGRRLCSEGTGGACALDDATMQGLEYGDPTGKTWDTSQPLGGVAQSPIAIAQWATHYPLPLYKEALCYQKLLFLMTALAQGYGL
jgi:hypothetical protein